jgi:hypothetical protein
MKADNKHAVGLAPLKKISKKFQISNKLLFFFQEILFYFNFDCLTFPSHCLIATE